MLQNTDPETATFNRFRAIIGDGPDHHDVYAMVDHLYLISGNWANVARADDDTLRVVAQHYI